MSSSSQQDDVELEAGDSSDEDVTSIEVDSDQDEDGDSEAGESEADDSQDDAPDQAADASSSAESDDENGVPALDASATESDEDDDDEVPATALDASATESDEDEDEVDDDEDIPTETQPLNANKSATVMGKITQELADRYQKRLGRQLFIRFPARLPEDIKEFDAKAKALSPLIVEAHKPRQKHARFCIVDFASTEDRDKVLKQITKTSAETKIFASLPKSESSDFVKVVAEKRLKKYETKLAKRKLKRQIQKATREKAFTSSIVVLNIPKSASTAQIKELFPDAVDVQVKLATGKFNGSSLATITLPSTDDAKKSVRKSLSLGGNKLIIRFNTPKKPKKNKSPKKGDGEAKPVKGPIAPKANGNKSNDEKKQKNKPQGVEASEKKSKLPLSQKRASDGGNAAEVPQKKTKIAEGAANKPEKKFKNKTDAKTKPFPKKNFKPNGKPVQNKGKKFPQKQGKPSFQKGVPGKKPHQPNKQKSKPQHKAK